MYRLFVSHSWAYGDQYQKLVNLLDSDRSFIYENYSVPKDDPVHNAHSVGALREAIWAKMENCDVVLILAGKYATHSKWINEEIKLTKRSKLIPKPIIGIKPWGNIQVSMPVRLAADEIINWNTDSIVGTIRRLAYR